MEIELLGWPPNGPKLPLDHERFSYAGKFVMTNTGKAVGREDGEVVAAIAFNEDRTDPDRLWLRYVTVARERRGERLGPRLVATVRDRALERGYDRVRIAVNNPYAYEALSRVGFRYTGETTGIAELVLEYPPRDGPSATVDPDRYRKGIAAFRERELTGDERAFLETRAERGPPERLE